MTTLTDLPNEMLCHILVRDFMQYESMAQCIITGFILRCTCRALRDAVDHHKADYHSLAKVPIHEAYDPWWYAMPWHKVAEVIFELARMGLVDRRALLPLNLYRHPKYYTVCEFNMSQEYDRAWTQKGIRRYLEWDQITNPFWILEGLCAGKHGKRISAALLASFRTDHIWTDVLLPMAARYDCPELYFWRKNLTLREHTAWKGRGITTSHYRFNGYSDKKITNHVEMLYVFASRRCFDVLLDSFVDPEIRHRQLLTMRANVRRMMRHLYEDSNDEVCRRMEGLLEHLDGRYREGLKRKRRKSYAAGKRFISACWT